MLISMHIDINGEFGHCHIIQEMWTYGGISAIWLHVAIFKFQTYMMDQKHAITEHVRVISTMIRDLSSACNNLNDELQILATVILLHGS